MLTASASLSSRGELDEATSSIGELAESRLGQLVGDKWELVSVLGYGGTACVYLAEHRNGRRAAIKILHPELARDARSRQRFLREAYAANRVRHPGAVQVLDDDVTSDGTPFLLLELLVGRSLGAFLEDATRLDVSEVVAIGAGVLDVLAAAHDASVVHRDIKPSNIFITADRRVKVLDFGIAKFNDASGHDPHLTRADAAMGTPAFMAPEQAAGRSAQVDARSDLWSVGATLFALLTGRTVHLGANANEVLIATATMPPPSLSSLRSDLPPAVSATIDRALSLDRNRRFPNARAMRAALTGMPLDQSSAVTAPETPARTAPAHVPWRLVVAGAAIVFFSVWSLASRRGGASGAAISATTVSAVRGPAPGPLPQSPAALAPSPGKTKGSSSGSPMTRARGPSPKNVPARRPVGATPSIAPAASGAPSAAPAATTEAVPISEELLLERRQ